MFVFVLATYEIWPNIKKSLKNSLSLF
jgi:hypothetical protein